MKKLPLKVDKIEKGDVLWDDLILSTGYADHELGNYYVVKEIKHGIFHENDAEYIQFNRYNREYEKRGFQQFSLDMFEMKHEDRIFKVEFDDVAEEAKFRLMIL